jgi:hypothetical protein
MDTIEIIAILILVIITSKLLIDLFGWARNYYITKDFIINKKLVLLYVLIYLIGLILDIYVFKTKDVVKLGLFLGTFITILIGLSILYGKYIYIILGLNSTRGKIITSIGNKGFKLVKGDKSKQYYWIDFTKGQITKKTLQLLLLGKNTLAFNKNSSNYYELLRKMPRNIQGIDYKIIDDFFRNLKS